MRSAHTFAVAGVLLASAILLIHSTSTRLKNKTVFAFTTSAMAAEAPAPPAWMLSPAAIQAMRDPGNDRAARAHAWKILESMVPDGTHAYDAAWDGPDWEAKCTLGLGGMSSVCANDPRPTSGPCQMPAPTSTPKSSLESPFQRPFDPAVDPHAPLSTPFLSSVRYDPDAASFIRLKCLYDAGKVVDLETAHGQFPRSSRIVKLIWAIPSTSTHEIHVWDPQLGDTQRYPDGAGKFGLWPKVTIDTGNGSCPARQAAPTRYTGNAPLGVVTLPLGCFYHRSYPCGALSAQTAIINQVPLCPPSGRYDLLLMGVHVITAEQPDWTWSTFWWTSDPSQEQALHGDEPPALQARGPWWHYAMRVALDPSKPSLNGANHIAYNPYLEGPQFKGTSGNCMVCHGTAAIHDKNNQRLAGTHMLWSIADNINPETAGRIQMSQ